MYRKRCEGCGRVFEAHRESRKWCSDNCSRRARRRAARGPDRASITAGPVIYPVSSPDITADDVQAYWHRSLSFARAVNPNFVMPDGRLADLLAGSGGQDADAATESDWDIVQTALVSRVVTGLQGIRSVWDDTAAVVVDLRMLLDFWDDLFDPAVIAALAAQLGGKARP